MVRCVSSGNSQCHRYKRTNDNRAAHLDRLGHYASRKESARNPWLLG
jgi:hypothetical protein